LLSPKIEFHAADLNAPIHLGEKFDLALSLEVAEHLNPQSSESFLSSASRLSGAVLFGAEFTAQVGTNHINTRPHSFWAQGFKSLGFDVFDVFRPRFWNDERVAPWYRQNTFVYARLDHPLHAALRARGHAPMTRLEFVDAVHPWLYFLALGEIARLQQIRAATPSSNPARNVVGRI
jgi:hypothetical protein